MADVEFLNTFRRLILYWQLIFWNWVENKSFKVSKNLNIYIKLVQGVIFNRFFLKINYIKFFNKNLTSMYNLWPSKYQYGIQVEIVTI